MTGSPFSNVVGHDSDSSTFQDVESTLTSDTTTLTAPRPQHSDGTESSLGVTADPAVPGASREAGQNETVGDSPSNQ